jgi:GR25 family glycosyltransferase involved in LPS biosynthesis
MKHYWINIDEYIERKIHMETQLKNKNIENFRISAITPSKLSNYNVEKNTDNSSTKEEISCIISHLTAIKKGYEVGDEYFCVMEDDILLNNVDFTKIINYIKKEETINNEKIDILQLHTSSHPCIIKLFNDNFLNNKIIIKSSNIYPSACYYLISRDGAKKILEKYVYINDNNIMNINLTQDEWCVSDNIIYISVNTYILTYPIITTNIKLGSSIHPEHLINHENSNIVIRDIWEKHNCLHLFN